MKASQKETFIFTLNRLSCWIYGILNPTHGYADERVVSVNLETYLKGLKVSI